MPTCSKTGGTHTGEGNAAVTALGGSGELLEVVVDKLATGCLYNPPAVGGGVVGSALAESDALGHCARNKDQRLASSRAETYEGVSRMTSGISFHRSSQYNQVSSIATPQHTTLCPSNRSSKATRHHHQTKTCGKKSSGSTRHRFTHISDGKGSYLGERGR